MKQIIGAIILAAGRSIRMGKPKLLLPWKETIVLDAVLQLALGAGLDPIVIVTGAFDEPISDWISRYAGKISKVHNPEFENFEMFYSLKMGILSLSDHCDAVMIFLGDQPQVQPQCIGQIIRSFEKNGSPIIIPSYRMRRGHPILVRKDLFQPILDSANDSNLHEFLASFRDKIDYVTVNSNSILEDIDSPEDYERIKKKFTP